MGGIAGIIRFDGAPVEPGLVEQMTAAMRHRGPDGIHHWVEGSVALGQCMLHTTPESLEEHQPLGNEDQSLVLVMDGRVDNWEELRRELLGRGAVLRTGADAELVLRAYELWGSACMPHIDGDFALLIWDSRRREAFCARDRIGNRPFVYHWDGNTLAFASELHAILALPWVPETLNEGVLAEFLANQWSSRDETFCTGVVRLVAAHRMTVRGSGPSPEPYWAPDLRATLPYSRDEEYVEHYRELFADVVRRMSRSHLPVAYEVSGGLDSSAIFAMAEHLRRQQRLPAPAILGYALEFRDAPDAEELQYSRAVGEHLGVRIAEVPATTFPFSWYRDWSRRYREFPGYPNGTMAIGLRKTAREHGCRTLLTGVGGDEWLGMPWTGAYYEEELALRQWRQVGACLLADCRELGITESLWRLLRHGVAPLLPAVAQNVLRSVRGNLQVPRPTLSWLSPKLADELERRRRATVELPARLERRGQKRQLDILYAAYDGLARESEERMSSALGLELRSPFHSQKIVQFAISTPERLRSRGRITKWMHRRALADILPRRILNRTGKADFMDTFRQHLDPLLESLRREVVPRRADWIRSGPAEAVCDGYADGSGAGWCEWWLWTLVGCDTLTKARS